MKVSACLCLVLGATCSTSLAAHTTTRLVRTQQATIVRVARTVPAQAFSGGDSPSDTPMQSEGYEYDITLRVGCGTYVGRYESAYDDLPSAISANNKVTVKLKRHYLDVDSGGQKIEMPIVQRQVKRGEGCIARR